MSKGVYLIKCPYSNIDMLKIGFSNNIEKRIKQHKTSNILIEPIGFIETDDYKELEKDIHYKCRKHRYNLEFFFCKDVILDLFKKHPNFIKL